MPERPADLVFTGGHVHTVDARRPRAEAVAIHGERISAVGSTDEIASAIGPKTRVVDLGGRLLLPGFQDAHVHPLSGGMDQMQCDLREAEGREAVLATIRTYADEHPATSGSSGAAGTWATSRAACRGARTSTASCRIGPASSRIATATRRG